MEAQATTKAHEGPKRGRARVLAEQADA